MQKSTLKRMFALLTSFALLLCCFGFAEEPAATSAEGTAAPAAVEEKAPAAAENKAPAAQSEDVSETESIPGANEEKTPAADDASTPEGTAGADASGDVSAEGENSETAEGGDSAAEGVVPGVDGSDAGSDDASPDAGETPDTDGADATETDPGLEEQPVAEDEELTDDEYGIMPAAFVPEEVCAHEDHEESTYIDSNSVTVIDSNESGHTIRYNEITEDRCQICWKYLKFEVKEGLEKTDKHHWDEYGEGVCDECGYACKHPNATRGDTFKVVNNYTASVCSDDETKHRYSYDVFQENTSGPNGIPMCTTSRRTRRTACCGANSATIPKHLRMATSTATWHRSPCRSTSAARPSAIRPTRGTACAAT